jgi:hypothetical protein
MHHDRTFLSRDPVVRTETGTWCRVVDVDGLGLRRAIAFEREITWIREAHARAVLVNGAGRDVSEGSQFCDVGTFLNCLASAMENARDMAREHGVGTGPFAVEVRLSVRDRAVLAQPRDRFDGASAPPRWLGVPSDWIAHGAVADVDAWLALDSAGRYEDRTTARRIEDPDAVEHIVAWTTPSPASRGTACARTSPRPRRPECRFGPAHGPSPPPTVRRTGSKP